MTKRKLKHPNKRKPEIKVGIREVVKEVRARTGFTAPDISLVINTTIDVIIEHILAKKAVILPRLGMFYPWIKTARTVMKMNGGVGQPEHMRMDDRWIGKYRPGNYLTEKLLQIKPTKEEVDNLYKD